MVCCISYICFPCYEMQLLLLLFSKQASYRAVILYTSRSSHLWTQRSVQFADNLGNFWHGWCQAPGSSEQSALLATALCSQPHGTGCGGHLGWVTPSVVFPLPLWGTWCLTLILWEERGCRLWDCNYQAALLPWQWDLRPTQAVFCVSTDNTSAVLSSGEAFHSETPWALT